MQLDAVKSTYRRYARFYDTVFGLVLQPGRKAVVEALQCRPGDRVLEVGVGTGLSLPLYPAEVTVTGIDVSREMLDKARHRVQEKNLRNVEALLEMDAEAMSLPGESFDKVVAMYVASVVPNPARLLAELHRVCKPDGEIFLVNHVRSENPILHGIEKGLGRFSDKIGFHADFDMNEMLDGQHEVTQVSRINFFWKVMRLKNGVAQRRFASPR